MTDPSVLTQITSLRDRDLPSLRDEWRRLFGTEPPGYGREMMRRRLVYRVQELAYGGLTDSVRQRLADIDAQAARRTKTREGIPVPGTVIIREWGGAKHEVTVLADGFEYQGRKWRSLTQIAKAITGTQWNGPLFFGLRAKAAKGGD